MKYFKIDNRTAIEYDEVSQRTRVLNIDVLKEEIDQAKEKLLTIPEPISNAELLAWAKENYQQTDYSTEITSLKAVRDTNQALVDLIKTL